MDIRDSFTRRFHRVVLQVSFSRSKTQPFCPHLSPEKWRAKPRKLKNLVGEYLNELEHRFNGRSNEFLFRDTLVKLVKAEKVAFKELTKAA